MDLHARIEKTRRLYLRYRRWLAAAAAAGYVLALAHELAPPDPETTLVVVAARDLRAGAEVGADDLQLARVAPAMVPAGATRSLDGLVGERLAAPLRRNEVLTDARVLASPLVQQYGPGLVAAPVRIPDADIVALVDVGDRVDVYAATGEAGSPAERVVSGASVITIPAQDARRSEGAVVVLALSDADTARLAQAAATTQLSISLR